MSYEQKIPKPWGYELIWAVTDKYVGKLLIINKDHSLSLQFHQVKDETIYLLSGKMEFYFDGHTHILNPGDSWHIEPLKHHMMKALENCVVVEVSTPELDDVVRLKDLYGRA